MNGGLVDLLDAGTAPDVDTFNRTVLVDAHRQDKITMQFLVPQFPGIVQITHPLNL